MSDLFNTGVRPVIDDYLLSEAAKVRDYGDYWSASSAGYCQRKLIFERLGVPKTLPDDPRKQRVFSAGHIFHDWIQKLTRDAGVSIAQEVELQDEYLMVRGHFDDLLLLDDADRVSQGDGELDGQVGMYTQEKKLTLYDYKTVNSRSFMWAKQNNNAMSYYHKMQLGTYLYMLRNTWDEAMGAHTKLKVGELTEARILKIEKENLMMMEQQLTWGPELESEVLEYWKSLNAHWKAKTLPQCTCEAHEGGFMAKEKFNPYYYGGEPCSLEYYKLWKAGKVVA